MSGPSKVSYERVGAAAVLTITRPERRNAVDDATADLLREGYERFERDDDARALVLTGEGPEAFCAGADLKAVAKRGEQWLRDHAAGAGGEAQQPPDIDSAVGKWLDERPDGPLGFTRLTPSKQTIAAISGWCLAGGI